MSKRKIFSIPVNPLMNNDFLNDKYIPFLIENKDVIYDMYATVRMEPFTQDAMGNTDIKGKESADFLFMLQNATGIPITPTFNNTAISPSLENMKLFVENLKPLYERGLKSVIVPFSHWVQTGIFKKEFPNLLVKNTILSKLNNMQNIYDAARIGYDYINVDRALMRNIYLLEQLPIVKKKIKERFDRDVMFSLLMNESCLGHCYLMDEHYLFNNTRKDGDRAYFSNPLSINSCTGWKQTDPAYDLKIANIPPHKELVDLYLNYVDTIKMHGRDNMYVLMDTMEIVSNYNKGNKILHELQMANLANLLGDKLEEFINGPAVECYFQCWNCDYCDQVVKANLKGDKK